jgi:hypothetical protein
MVAKKNPSKHHITGLVGTAILWIVIVGVLWFVVWSYVTRKPAAWTPSLIPEESRKLELQDFPTAAQ